MANLQNKSDYQRINLMAGENANEYMNLRNALNNYLGEDLNKYEPREALGVVCGDDDWNSKTAAEIVCDYIGVDKTKYTLKEALNFVENFFSNKYRVGFDGANDYINLDSPVNCGTTHMFSFWIGFSGFDAAGYLLGDTIASDYRLLQMNNDYIYYRASTNNKRLLNVFSGYDPQHIVIIRNEGTFDVYRNSVHIETAAGFTGGDWVWDNIGRRTGSANSFWGNLDEIALFTTGVPPIYSGNVPSQVVELYGGGTPETCGDASGIDGITHYWRMEEGTGTTTEDSVGGNDGTLLNGTQWETYE
jgi:hypothetical protein